MELDLHITSNIYNEELTDFALLKRLRLAALLKSNASAQVPDSDRAGGLTLGRHFSHCGCVG